MKKLALYLILSGLAASMAMAQETVFAAKLDHEKVPSNVVASVEKDFPDATVAQYAGIPVEYIGENWIVRTNYDAANTEKFDTYVVALHSKNFNGEATYDANGNLLYARERIQDAPLPMSITRSIESQYPGWAAEKDHELITFHKEGQKKAYYRLTLMKGAQKEHVTYDAHGNKMESGMKGRHEQAENTNDIHAKADKEKTSHPQHKQ